MLEVLFLATIATGNCGLDKLDSPVCNSPLSPRFISSLFPLSSLSLFPSFAAISKKHAATTNCALTINPLSTQLIGKLRNRETKNRARVVFIETFLRVLTNRNWTISLSLFTLFRLVRKFSQTRYQERKRIYDEADRRRARMEFVEFARSVDGDERSSVCNAAYAANSIALSGLNRIPPWYSGSIVVKLDYTAQFSQGNIIIRGSTWVRRKFKICAVFDVDRAARTGGFERGARTPPPLPNFVRRVSLATLGGHSSNEVSSLLVNAASIPLHAPPRITNNQIIALIPYVRSTIATLLPDSLEI